MLPWLFHPDLAQLDEKHPTQCVAAAVHFFLRKAMFKTAILQTKVAGKFRVAPKKLHKAITGQKYDPGHKPTKAERRWKEANTVKPSPRKDKSPEGKQKTSGKKTDEAASETSEMDTTETEMPPLLEASNNDSNDDENGAKSKKFQFKKPTPKPRHGSQF